MTDELLTREHFDAHVGKKARFANTSIALVIDRIEGGGEPPKGWPRAPFVVVFAGPPGRENILPEGPYDCEIEDGPTFNLYVMPIYTPAPGRQEYQAAFN